MKRIIASYSHKLFPCFFLFMMMSGCSGSSEPAVFDGLYLKYRIGTSSSCRISFDKISRNRFKVIMEPYNYSLCPGGYQDGKELIVDKFLRPAKKRLLSWGEAVLIWLPADTRKTGSRLHVGGLDSISEVKHWKEWEVAVITAQIGGGFLTGTWYYDVKTGFLVGMEKEFAGDKNLIILLEETNAGG